MIEHAGAYKVSGMTRPARTPGLGLARVLVWALFASLAACNVSDLLHAPTPAGVAAGGSLTGVTGAEALRAGAIGVFSNTYWLGNGQVGNTGLLTDEFASGFTSPSVADIDARQVAFLSSGGQYPTDALYSGLQKARLSAALAAHELESAGPSVARDEIGAMFALAGYAEVLLAEDFCSGVPLSLTTPSGSQTTHGMPLTTDSVLGAAIVHFDSALAYVGGDSVGDLARLGRARALTDRGAYTVARAAADSVQPGFAYVVELPQGSTVYASILQGFPYLTVGNREGGTGLDFVSASDPRLPIDSTLGPDLNGNTLYYPTKFPAGISTLPFARWVEARLISAEAALAAGDIAGWSATLNTLRQTAITPAMDTLTSDSTTGASADLRISVLFRERAFWLFGEGHRLGDLRRLVRQYGRAQDAVFPTGPYPFALAGIAPTTYGADVNFPIAAAEQPNPNFHGCLNRSA